MSNGKGILINYNIHYQKIYIIYNIHTYFLKYNMYITKKLLHKYVIIGFIAIDELNFIIVFFYSFLLL